MADKVQALLSSYLPVILRQATGQVQSMRVSEFLKTWWIWQVKARRRRQQETEESGRGKCLWLGWNAWLGSHRLQDVSCATGNRERSWGQRPLGQPNLLQGLLRLAGDQPWETLGGFRGWGMLGMSGRTWNPAGRQRWKILRPVPQRAASGSPGERGVGWEELESEGKVGVFHLPMPKSLKHRITATKCHCGGGGSCRDHSCGQAGELWVRVGPSESHRPRFLEKWSHPSGSTLLSLSFPSPSVKWDMLPTSWNW